MTFFRIDREETVIAVRGELDIATAPQLRAALIEAIDTHPGEELIVDLNGVEFIDSAGLGMLVGGRRRARERRGDLILVSTGRIVGNVLKLTGLDRVFDVHESVEGARGWSVG
jgi:anti-sigma B factor antagonist